jgi:hypothetical protein
MVDLTNIFQSAKKFLDCRQAAGSNRFNERSPRRPRRPLKAAGKHAIIKQPEKNQNSFQALRRIRRSRLLSAAPVWILQSDPACFTRRRANPAGKTAKLFSGYLTIPSAKWKE